jgi:HD-like signal output (HDOD) protein/ActR/RegA family two-component response regulator
MKRVLFVDDDTSLLDGLRVRLHALRSQWKMVFVENGPRAIAELEQRPVDVIVADVRMPTMDGVQLLEIVRDRWPDAIRIVLSGCAEEEQSGRLLSVVHQYISKPCEVHQLESVIGRCMQLRDVLNRPQLQALVGRIAHLPAMPRTCTSLRNAMADPDVSVREVARIIHEDPAVAAKVLQLVNSAFFRLARRITSVEQAVGYLGFNAIRTLVMSVEVFSAWSSDVGTCELTPTRLQEEAHRVAAAARALAHGTALADDALLAGLLHNIGYWVLLQECPGQVQRAVEIARTSGISLHAAEEQVLGASHAAIGAYLLGVWGLPYPVIEAVAFQHCPQRVRQKRFDVLAALVVAQTLQAGGEPLVRGAVESCEVAVDARYLQALHAPFDWAEAQQRVCATNGELH